MQLLHWHPVKCCFFKRLRKDATSCAFFMNAGSGFQIRDIINEKDQLNGHQLQSVRLILKKCSFGAQKNGGKYSNWGIYSGLTEADIRFIQYRFHCIWNHRKKRIPKDFQLFLNVIWWPQTALVICKWLLHRK